MVDELTGGAFDEPVEGIEIPEERFRRGKAFIALGRVLVLPRSTFARIASGELTTWPTAGGLLLVAAVTKAALALGFGVRTAASREALYAVWIRYAAGLVGPLAFAAAAAGVLLVAQRWWRGDAPFTRLLSGTTLALVPIALRDLLQFGYMTAAQRVLVHPGFAALVAPPSSSALRSVAYAALGTIDLFTLWAFVLLTLAACVSGGTGWIRRMLVAAFVALAGAAIGALPSLAVASLLAR